MGIGGHILYIYYFRNQWMDKCVTLYRGIFFRNGKIVLPYGEHPIGGSPTEKKVEPHHGSDIWGLATRTGSG